MPGRKSKETVCARLLERGVEAMTDAELLSVLLKEPGEHANGCSEQWLDSCGGLRGLLLRETQALRRTPGMDESQAMRLIAATELGRRLGRAPEVRPRLKTPQDVYRYLAPSLSTQPKECFHVLSFNSRNILLDNARVAEGTPYACPVDPREVFRATLFAGGLGMVLAHNHPSGDPEPSTQDLALTSQLAQGAASLGIRLLDHIVVGGSSFVSLRERGFFSLGEQRTGPSKAAFGI